MMMAMLFAQRVILGKATYDPKLVTKTTALVPPALQKGVAEVLLDSGLPELVPVALGGTMELDS